jgi:hypothetical protein
VYSTEGKAGRAEVGERKREEEKKERKRVRGRKREKERKGEKEGREAFESIAYLLRERPDEYDL